MFDPGSLTTGAIVPSVSTGDLSAVVKLMLDFEKEHGGGGAVGLSVYQGACSCGADVGAVWWRCAMLCLALKQGEFVQFVQEASIDERFLRLWSTFPFRAVNVQADGTFQLNQADFEQALHNLDSERA